MIYLKIIIEAIKEMVIPRVDQEARRLEEPLLVAPRKVLLRHGAHAPVLKRQGVAQVELALEERVLEQLVHVHEEAP